MALNNVWSYIVVESSRLKTVAIRWYMHHQECCIVRAQQWPWQMFEATLLLLGLVDWRLWLYVDTCIIKSLVLPCTTMTLTNFWSCIVVESSIDSRHCEDWDKLIRPSSRAYYFIARAGCAQLTTLTRLMLMLHSHCRHIHQRYDRHDSNMRFVV